jgi:hypothetical protein
MSERFTNARVHEWLSEALDAVAEQTHSTRLQLNSAALYWFLSKLTAAERAELLGEYTKALAMLHQEQGEADGRAGGKAKGGRKKKR